MNILRHRPIERSIEIVAIDGPFGGDIRLCNDNSTLTRRLFYLAEYEASEWYWWAQWCARASSVLELGANTGFYTIIGARSPSVRQYVAVEPHPHTATMLTRNLELNGVTRVRVVKAAAVGEPGRARMALHVPLGDPDATPQGAFLATARLDGRRDSRDTVMVDVIEARGLIEGVDLIKMDIEGEEVHVLRSAEDILAARRPTIFLEVLERNSELRAYLPTLCARCGYVVRGIGRQRLYHLSPSDVGRERSFRQSGTRDVIVTTTAWDG